MKKRIYVLIILLLLFLSTLTASNINLTSYKTFSSVQQNSTNALTDDDLAKNVSSQTMSFLKNYRGEGVLIINASDYDGENDTERLQAALNDVPPEGAIVLIPSGVWVASGLIAKSNTTILGMNATIIQRPENTTVPFITFENASNFAVLNLTFDGKDIKNGYGILIIDGKSFTIQGNDFLDVRKSAIKVNLSFDGFSENFTIADNSFMNSHNAPILLFGGPMKRAIRGFVIANNTIINGTNNGKIGVAFSANGLIVNNTVRNSQHGIATRCVSNITIRANVIENAADYGIYLGTQIGDNGTDNIIIEGNVVANSGIGIARWYGSYPIKNVTVVDNHFVNNTLYDIYADFPATFVNNTVTSAEKLVIVDAATVFIDTKTITNELIIPEDVNLDLKVNIEDLAIIGICFGSTEQSANWNATADIIKDGVINISDISYAGKRFGFAA